MWVVKNECGQSVQLLHDEFSNLAKNDPNGPPEEMIFGKPGVRQFTFETGKAAVNGAPC